MTYIPGTYAGETANKKFARFQFWTRLLANDSHRFMRAKFLVLASEYCGDVSFLVGFGIPRENIIACDINPLAIEACQNRFPGVRTYLGDVGDIAEMLGAKGERVQYSLLDFCGTITRSKIETVGKVVNCFHSDKSVLGTVFYRARERGGIRNEVNRHQQIVSEKIAIGVRSKDAPDPSRYSAFIHEFNAKFFPSYIGLMPTLMVQYQSCDEGERIGSPMEMLACNVIKVAKQKGRALQTRNTFGFRMCQAHDEVFVNGPGVITLGRHDLSEEDARNATLDMAELYASGGNKMISAGVTYKLSAANMFNVSEQTLAAWKAHASRSSYGDCKVCQAPISIRNEAIMQIRQHVVAARAQGRQISIGGLCSRHIRQCEAPETEELLVLK